MAERPKYDFSNLDNAKFCYMVPPVKDGDPPLEVMVDIEEAALQLHQTAPTLFQARGELDDQGRQLNGLGVSMKCLVEGKPLPHDVPDMLTVYRVHARNALLIPTHCGINVIAAVFWAWVEDMNRRAELKKALPSSPASSEPTPALSAPTT
jgi:hypothetical protein